jgi:hypothetical protein
MRNRTVLLSVIVLVSGYLLLLRDWYRSVQPPGNSLEVCLTKLPHSPEKSKEFVSNGNKYLAVFGQLPTFPRFPSGCPVYIFDATRQLVDWTSDEGDDPGFNDRWGKEWRGGRKITRDELVRWPAPNPAQ